MVQFFSSALSSIQSSGHKSWKLVSNIAGFGSSDQSRATSSPEEWPIAICRLDLYIDAGSGRPAVGSGFFLNVPGATKDVLVTAGHNLIRPQTDPGSKPKRTSKIGIRCHDAKGKPTTVIVTDADYHISQQYEQSQSPDNAVHDYGIILLDRPLSDNGDPQPRYGFGFNVMLAAMDLSSMEPEVVLTALVGGYPEKDNGGEKPRFSHRTGAFGEHEGRQVLYHASTDQGMNGGPVWVNHDGEDIVVGIHNYHEEVKGAGNRGTRLDMRTMKDICRWSGADFGLLNKAIKVKEAKPSLAIPAEGLYLQLGSSDDSNAGPIPLAHARSGHARNPILTTFDIIPVQASPCSFHPSGTSHALSSKENPGPPRFAFVHGQATGSPKFLQFNTDPTAAPRQVTGVETLNAACLVQLDPPPFTNRATGNSFKITMLPHHKVGTARHYKVVLSPWNIPPEDNAFELPLESLGVLVRKKSDRASKDPVTYEEFQIE